MVNEYLTQKYRIVNHMNAIYVTFNFGRSFVINSMKFMQEND